MGKRKEVDPIEQSITVKYRNKLFSKFVGAIDNYKLIQPGDKICVCISGGKDSMLMARLFMQLKKTELFNEFYGKKQIKKDTRNQCFFF